MEHEIHSQIHYKGFDFRRLKIHPKFINYLIMIKQ
jgi:hypothetical protein